MADLIDLTGQRFGKLTVIERAVNDRHGRSRWLCQCDCGNQSTVQSLNLRQGHTTSCGCYRREQPTVHGYSVPGEAHPLYATWQSMKSRCFDPNRNAYKYYGAQGVTVCDRWSESFEAFLEDVGERPPTPNDWTSSWPYWSLDRIDPYGNYEPDNVRWATWIQQRHNQRNRGTHVDKQATSDDT